jgi:hypothetical protein
VLAIPRRDGWSGTGRPGGSSVRHSVALAAGARVHAHVVQRQPANAVPDPAPPETEQRCVTTGACRIPVALWLYLGDSYVSTQQALKAFRTWLGDPRSSKAEAARLASELAAKLESRQASPAAQQSLKGLLADIAYRGKLDDEDELRRAVQNVFEPGHGLVRKVVGHPAAPLSTDALGSRRSGNAPTSRAPGNRRSGTDRPCDLCDLLNQSFEARQVLDQSARVERDGVLHTGRALLVVEAAVSLDRDAVQRDAESLSLTVSVVQDAEGH